MKIAVISIALTGLFAAISWAQDPTPQVPVTIDSTRPASVAPQDKTGTEERAQAVLVVKEMGFGTGVESRELVGEAAEFPAAIGRLYYWTEIANSGDSTSISHVWYFGGLKVSQVELPVRPLRNRTWSYKTILSGSAGVWRVEVMTPGGQVIAVDSCAVR